MLSFWLSRSARVRICRHPRAGICVGDSAWLPATLVSVTVEIFPEAVNFMRPVGTPGHRFCGGERGAVQLQRVEPAGPGYSRRRRGRGFSYYDEDGAPVTDPETLRRIRSLVIPPAWRDVWICPLPGGHIQAVGTDDAGRRQYLYHDEWRRQRDAAKYDRVLRLGRRLPAVRAQIREHLEGRGLTCERVLAAALRMLDIGAFRVGGEEYAPAPGEEEGTFGLATVRRAGTYDLVDENVRGRLERALLRLLQSRPKPRHGDISGFRGA